jgi:hypothetical protein
VDKADMMVLIVSCLPLSFFNLYSIDLQGIPGALSERNPLQA